MTHTRRDFGRSLFAAGTAAAAMSALGARAEAAAPGVMTPAEQANVKVVTDFCAAWPGRDVDRLMSFFADDGAYRMTETTELAKGRDAVTARIKTIVNQVVRFDVIETFARGPMVINERIDHFDGTRLKSWHGVGVFFLRNGKIVDWYDYTIALERA